MTAEGFWTGVFLGAVVAICCHELGRALADLSAVRSSRIVVPVPERRSSLPSYRQEAINAKRGVWR